MNEIRIFNEYKNKFAFRFDNYLQKNLELCTYVHFEANSYIKILVFCKFRNSYTKVEEKPWMLKMFVKY